MRGASEKSHPVVRAPPFRLKITARTLFPGALHGSTLSIALPSAGVASPPPPRRPPLPLRAAILYPALPSSGIGDKRQRSLRMGAGTFCTFTALPGGDEAWQAAPHSGSNLMAGWNRSVIYCQPAVTGMSRKRRRAFNVGTD